MTQLELLAPARNADIGIAAIDCGADAVYMAGPEFGARQAAGNSVEDIRRVCEYAHKFGARVFVTMNTIIYEDELERAASLAAQVRGAGADALIVQDLAMLKIAPGGILHASTQCAIRTPETAAFYESLGFGRLVLEREMSLAQIRSIRQAVSCELEFFVHGALCVCYSGNCYLSEFIEGRSANRGSCIQACRSRYDLTDASGKVLVKDKALLSLKDYNLLSQLESLAEEGVCSFKIEGRLKNASYVKNVVREYSRALDTLVAKYPQRYCRSSFGRVTKGFTPDMDKTFNRGYTSLFIEGRRGKWSSMDAPKGMGEKIGRVASVRDFSRYEMEVRLTPSVEGLKLQNGDGFSVVGSREVIGFRGDVCEGIVIRCRKVPGIAAGQVLYRNFSSDFERQLEASVCKREIEVNVSLSFNGEVLRLDAVSEDGRRVSSEVRPAELAKDRDRMEGIFRQQISKSSGIYSFRLNEVNSESLPFLSASEINALRRSLAGSLDLLGCISRPMAAGRISEKTCPSPLLDYHANISNPVAESVYFERGASVKGRAYELDHPADAELMRTKYCIRYELGICPKYHGVKDSGPLFLKNNGRTLALAFDCRDCEMKIFPKFES